MKKLLFVPLFGVLTWLGSCGFSAIVPPTPSEMIKQAHEALPSVPALPQITVPTFNPVKLPPQPKVTRVRPVKPRVLSAPPVPYVAEEPPAADVQLECIWPLRLIPGCQPQESGRMP